MSKPDSSLHVQSCCSPRLHLLAPRLRPLQLLLVACVRFESAAAPWPDCIRFNCCSPFACVRFQLLLPDFARFSCCCMLAACQLLLPIASASAAAPQLRPLRLLLPDCVHPLAAPAAWIPAQCSRTFFAEFEVHAVNKLKYEGRVTIV